MLDLSQQPPEAFFYEEAIRSEYGTEIASIIKFPAEKNKSDLTYAQLPCDERDQRFIYELISAIAQNGSVNLLFQQSHLKQLGAQINHVHPLKFLATIFNHEMLRVHMIDIFEDYFKRTNFLDGLSLTLTKDSEKGKLDPFLKEFAADIQITVEEIQKYFQKRDWEGLVRHLIEIKNNHSL